MAKNLLVINVDIRETRVALIENGIIAELHIERESSEGTLGNIYVGKVSRVLPGMQAAFIDVGLERAAFLHVEDLIRPDDFDAYLSGHRGGAGSPAADEDRASGPSAEEAALATPDAAGPPIELPTAIDVLPEPEEEITFEEGGGAAMKAEESASGEIEIGGEPEGDERDAVLDASWDDDDDKEDADAEPLDAPGASADDDDDDKEDAEAATSPADDADEPDADPGIGSADDAEADMPAFVETPLGAGAEVTLEEGQPLAAATGTDPAPLEQSPGGARSKRVLRSGRSARIRRSGRTGDRQPQPQAQQQQQGGGNGAPRERDRGRGGRDGRHGRDKGGRDKGGGGREGHKSRHGEPPRISKATPIRDVVREGQEVIVQISKEPIGTKGARVTSHISLPGRYVVYLPTVDHIGISKRIGSERERSRLRESIEAMKPPKGGLIVRTLAEGLTKKQLKADVGYLVRLWGEVAKKREGVRKAPEVIYQELDLILKTARDLFTDDIEKIVIDDREQYGRLKRFVEMFMPERAEAVEFYDGMEPIFDAYGIEDEIQRALARKVPLSSGGHLIIDQAEALTAIDVNTGRFVGKGSKDLEDTILKTNLEAVEEIAYQLRFRNLGGLIILDLIDMERAGNREKVRRHLENLLAKDKAKTTLNRISDLGLIEMTRKRTRESLGRTILEPCFYCDGTGQLQSKQTVAYEILRQIRRERLNLPGYKVIVNAHPAVIDLLKNDERSAVAEAEKLFTRRIELVPRKEYHLEQFDLQGR